MARWVGRSGVVGTIVPASPARVTCCRRPVSRLICRQVARSRVRRGGSAAAPASTTGRGRGCGAPAGETPGAAAAGTSGPGSPLGLQQVLVAQRDVLGGQVRVGGG